MEHTIDANKEIKAEVEHAVDRFWGEFLGYGEKDKSSFGQQWILLRVMVNDAVVAGYKVGLRKGLIQGRTENGKKGVVC